MIIEHTSFNFKYIWINYISQMDGEHVILQISQCYLILNSCACTFHFPSRSRFDSNFGILVCLARSQNHSLHFLSFFAYNSVMVLLYRCTYRDCFIYLDLLYKWDDLLILNHYQTRSYKIYLQCKKTKQCLLTES